MMVRKIASPELKVTFSQTRKENTISSRRKS